MLTLIIVISFPVLLSYIFASFSRLPVASFIPISYFLSVIWLYFFGVADQLFTGLVTLILLTFAIYLICWLKIKDFMSREKLIVAFSPSLVIFVTVSTWMFRHSQHMRFKEWDEFSQWGPAVKSMVLFDKIGPYSPAHLVFPEYPPGLSLFSYFVTAIGRRWMKLMFFGHINCLCFH